MQLFNRPHTVVNQQNGSGVRQNGGKAFDCIRNLPGFQSDKQQVAFRQKIGVVCRQGFIEY